MAPESEVPTCAVCHTPSAEHVEECPACHTPYRRYLQDLDRDRQWLTCSRCGAVQDLNAAGEGEGERTVLLLELAEAMGPTTAASYHPRPVTPRPPGVRLEQDERHTRVCWRSSAARHVGLLLLGLGCEAAWFALSHGLAGERSGPGLFLGGVLGGLGLLLVCRALMRLERTSIEATHEEVAVHHELLAWRRKGPRVKRSELVQLYARRATRFGDVEETYQLCALVRRGSRVILVTGLKHENEALYLEQFLERQLGIEDDLVRGELATRVPLWIRPGPGPA